MASLLKEGDLPAVLACTIAITVRVDQYTSQRSLIEK